MVLAGGLLGLLLLAFWLYCVVDAITSDAASVRNLPKLMWVVIVVLLLDIGGLLWVLAGRPDGAARSGRRRVLPQTDRPGREVASNPDDDAAFLAELRRRAEEQRAKAAEEARRRDEDDEPSR